MIGPAVRLLLQNYQIDPEKLKASGPKGNLLKSDVISHISKSNLKPHAKPQTVSIPKIVGSQKKQGRKKYEDIPLKDGNSKRNLTEAHYSLTSELIVDDLLKFDSFMDIISSLFCSELRKFGSKTEQINSQHTLFNDFVQKASSEACKRVPQANIIVEPFVSVSQAVVESERNQGRLNSNEFRVSNLGSHDSVDHFTPIGQLQSQTYTVALGSTKKRLMPTPEG